MEESSPAEAQANEGQARLSALNNHLEQGLVGRTPLVERLLIGLLADGHLLVEGAPGLAKTRAVKLLSDGLDASFARIQCTPDLMPADLTGTLVFRPDSGSFEFVEGPVFHSLVLVDEINRAPPKVQSALLEAMAERQVTAGGKTYGLHDPFMVVATQNPIEHEGTFPLPEAQLDRFLLHVLVDMPNADEERRILDLVEKERQESGPAAPDRLAVEQIKWARAAAMQVHVAPALKDFIVRLVMATRDPAIAPEITEAIEHPVSPRGTLALTASAKAKAYLDGRDHVIPEDVAALASDALSHRLVLTWRAAAEGMTPRRLIDRLLEIVHPL